MNKVLIIEDHPDMLDLLGRQIELMGFEPIIANLGAEGVAKAVSEIPDLIMLDIMMPGMDGREVAKQIRTYPALKDVPIVAATALFRDSDLEQCIEAGCNSYIVKPFTFRQLERTVRQYIPTVRAS